MDKKDWIEIRENCPRALERCAQHFRKQYGKDWKLKMREEEALKRWFWNKGIQIVCYENSGYFQYRLVLPGFGHYEAEEEALDQAFKKAFELFENEFKENYIKGLGK